MSQSINGGVTAGLCILVVDDSPIMRKMVIHSLKVAGIQVATLLQAAHGGEALESIASQRPQLVLCDVHMPTMDGAELVRRLSEQGRLQTVPVVMISSERNEAQQKELELLGVRAYLHKPFYPEALGKVVREVLDLKEAS